MKYIYTRKRAIRKVVCFEDGAVWNEVTEPVVEIAEFELHGIKFQKQVWMYCTEIWDSENSIS